MIGEKHVLKVEGDSKEKGNRLPPSARASIMHPYWQPKYKFRLCLSNIQLPSHRPLDLRENLGIGFLMCLQVNDLLLARLNIVLYTCISFRPMPSCCVYVCMCVCLHAYICICVYICVYICIHILYDCI